MNLSLCPYCEQPGLVMTVAVHGNGVDVTGKCTACGYSYDSEYAEAEAHDDLPGDYSRSLESTAAD